MTSSRATRKSPLRLHAMVPALSLLKDELSYKPSQGIIKKNVVVGADPHRPVSRGPGKASRATTTVASVTPRAQTPTRRGIGFPQCLTPTQRSPVRFSRMTSNDSVNSTAHGFDTVSLAEDIVDESNCSEDTTQTNDCGSNPRKESLADFLARSKLRNVKKRSPVLEALSTTTVRATTNDMPLLPFEAKSLFEGTQETIQLKRAIFAQLKFESGKADVVYVKAPLLDETFTRPFNQNNQSFDELDVPCVRVNVTSSAA